VLRQKACPDFVDSNLATYGLPDTSVVTGQHDDRADSHAAECIQHLTHAFPWPVGHPDHSQPALAVTHGHSAAAARLQSLYGPANVLRNGDPRLLPTPETSNLHRLTADLGPHAARSEALQLARLRERHFGGLGATDHRLGERMLAPLLNGGSYTKESGFINPRRRNQIRDLGLPDGESPRLIQG